MILIFEYSESIGSGHSPQAVHMMDNGFRIIYVNDNGLVNGLVSFPELGLYDGLSWEQKSRMSPDEGIACPSLKKVAHHGAYGFWSADGLNNTTDHKFVMYMLPTDISETLIDGTINHSKDSAVSSASFTFQNVHGYLLRRYRSVVMPNAKIELYYSMGDSDEISLGQWYIDRVTTSIPGNDISVSARNAIGKLLLEQTFDEQTSFTESALSDNLRAILEHGGVEDFFVGDAGKSWKLSFEAQDTLLGGIEDIIRLLPNWKIGEMADGVIGIGSMDDARFEQPSTYRFERDRNCWGYSTEYCDEQTYSRVCVSCKNPENTLYVDLPPHKLWPIPEHRTLFVTVPDGTSAAELQTYAQNLADSVAITGRTETFAGRFTPQMVIGDAIEMTADGETENIGVVTSVKHSLGRNGFYTEFTVDSGGRKGKPMLKDYVAQLSGNKTSKSVITNES